MQSSCFFWNFGRAHADRDLAVEDLADRRHARVDADERERAAAAHGAAGLPKSLQPVATRLVPTFPVAPTTTTLI